MDGGSRENGASPGSGFARQLLSDLAGRVLARFPAACDRCIAPWPGTAKPGPRISSAELTKPAAILVSRPARLPARQLHIKNPATGAGYDRRSGVEAGCCRGRRNGTQDVAGLKLPSSPVRRNTGHAVTGNCRSRPSSRPGMSCCTSRPARGGAHP